MDLRIVEQAGNARAAVVGDQGHAMAARQQFLGERMGGDHVPPGAARGEDIVARHHLESPRQVTE